MTPFSIDNLPYGVISTAKDTRKRCAVAFEDSAIDLERLSRGGFFAPIANLPSNVFSGDTWNAFAVLPADLRASVRAHLRQGIQSHAVDHAKIPLSQVQNHLPMDTRNFSDFYCSKEHAQNCSKIMGGGNLPSNWAVIPSVYNGRTSSLAVSGTPVTRPWGVFAGSSPSVPTFQPEPHLDFELEMGVWLAKPVPRGQRLAIADAPRHIFGLTLLNDWSSRKIQMFEMPPLGPFHSKGSGTTISPWIVPVEALAPFQCERKVPQNPPPPPHLTPPPDSAAALTYDIHLSAKLHRGGKLYTLCETNLNELHWTPIQQLTHLSAAGEGLSPGDVFGTGTISSDRTNAVGEKTGLGCIFERHLPEAKLQSLPPDLLDTFVQDGDEVILEGWCKDKRTGDVILGFGESRAKVLPALA
ncbi:fumarylacetoacetate hydrolase [Niveomyces insectorum RCEF 264]|uniref:Fumarylacetoacetase n=1 Tax=Niveomyces insectorum RCEF 264 TaxID=1081102 RepID=A0A167ZX57_9HYPO|nr:fumarylacetoacetate hydrolase [Niveomyces insectorum RCEF 264]